MGCHGREWALCRDAAGDELQQREGGGWIKRLLSERRRKRNEKGTLLAYHHLPRDFCKREAIAVTMQEVEGR